MYSAPSIRRPIAERCTRVIVDGCVRDPGNRVRLEVDGVRSELPADFETITFTVPPLAANAALRVFQGVGSPQESGASEIVAVQAVPDPLTPPVFETALFTKSRGASMTHVVPGAWVKVYQGGTAIGQALAETDRVIVPFTGAPNGFAAGSVLTAVIERDGKTSPPVTSQKLVDPPVVAPLKTRPIIPGAALECATSIPVGDSFAGATVFLERGGKTYPYLVGGSGALLAVDKLNANETLVFTQSFGVTEWFRSEPVKATATASAPGQPAVTGTICPLRDSDIVVEGVGGARVYLRPAGKAGPNLLVGVIAGSTGNCVLRVPAALVPKGAASFDVVLDLCGRVSPPRKVDVQSAPSTVPGEPRFATRLYDCGRVVALTGLTPNTMVKLVSAKFGVIGSKLVTAADETIAVSPLLVFDDAISISGVACSGEFGGQDKQPVLHRPTDRPLKFPNGDPQAGAASVVVSEITEGSRVDVFIGSQLVASEDVATDQHTFHVPTINVGDVVSVQQHDCRGPEERVTRSAPAAKPKTLKATIDTTDEHSQFFVTVGVPTHVLATVTDADSGAPVNATVTVVGVSPASFPANVPVLITAKYDGTPAVSIAAAGYPSVAPTIMVKPAVKLGASQTPPATGAGDTVNVETVKLTCKFADDAAGVLHPISSLPTTLNAHRRKNPVN
ncbi:MAG: hypothetical protein WCC60_09430, partial [Ilumatobacteraceae bacterium]